MAVTFTQDQNNGSHTMGHFKVRVGLLTIASGTSYSGTAGSEGVAVTAADFDLSELCEIVFCGAFMNTTSTDDPTDFVVPTWRKGSTDALHRIRLAQSDDAVDELDEYTTVATDLGVRVFVYGIE